MGDRVAVVWDDRLAEYDFGPGHPMTPVRLQLAMRLAGEFGLFERVGVEIVSPVDVAPEETILRVHEAEYVAAVRRASGDPHFFDAVRGLGTEDDPVFPNMHEAASRVAGATLLAAQLVHEGRAEHAVNLAGGLHHALPGAAEGFCVYNDIAVGIAWLLDQGVERVAYVDIDVHHGDGVQAIFWDDPRVMTISIHESPQTLFPGSGWPSETGSAAAPGTAADIAIPAGTATRAGFVRSTPSCRICWGLRPAGAGQPSMVWTRTSRIRSHTSWSRSTASAWPSRPCTGGLIATQEAVGSPSAAADTSGWRSFHGRGRI